MNLKDLFTSRRPAGVHRATSSDEERAALRESLDAMTQFEVRQRVANATKTVDTALAAVRSGRVSATDALLDVRAILREVDA